MIVAQIKMFAAQTFDASFIWFKEGAGDWGRSRGLGVRGGACNFTQVFLQGCGYFFNKLHRTVYNCWPVLNVSVAFHFENQNSYTSKEQKAT